MGMPMCCDLVNKFNSTSLFRNLGSSLVLHLFSYICAMAKIKRNRQDHQAIFLHFFLFLLLFGYQVLTQGKIKLPYARYTLDSHDSESPIILDGMGPVENIPSTY